MPSPLEQARVERGISKEEIMRRTGLVKETVYKALRGDRVARSTIVAIAGALGVTLADLEQMAAEQPAALAEVS